MRAVRAAAGEGQRRRIEVADVPVPSPGPGQVLVRVGAVCAGRLDLAVVGGYGLGAGVVPPRVLGQDPAGEIVWLGGGVPAGLLGRRVVAKPNVFCGACAYCARGAEADCRNQSTVGVHLDGGAAEYVVLPARAVVEIPDGVDDATASAAVHSVSIALHMIRVAGGVERGQNVLVTGATGAVGSAALQLARVSGARISAVVSTDNVGRASALGADLVFDRTCDPDFGEAVRELTEGGVALAIENTGDTSVFGQALLALGWKGRAVSCTARPDAPLSLDFGRFYRNRNTLLGTAAADLADVRDALDLVATGKVRPEIAATYVFEDAIAAFQTLADGGTSGKILIILK